MHINAVIRSCGSTGNHSRQLRGACSTKRFARHVPSPSATPRQHAVHINLWTFHQFILFDAWKLILQALFFLEMRIIGLCLAVMDLVLVLLQDEDTTASARPKPNAKLDTFILLQNQLQDQWSCIRFALILRLQESCIYIFKTKIKKARPSNRLRY